MQTRRPLNSASAPDDRSGTASSPVSIALLFGIALPAGFPALPSLVATVATAVAFLALHVWLRQRLTLWLVALALGLCWGTAYAHRTVQQLLPASLEREELRLTGRIAGLPAAVAAHGRAGQRFRFAIDSCTRQDGSVCPGALRMTQLRWFGDTPVAADEAWALTVRLRRPHGFANVGGFDYERWLVAQGVGATGSVRAAAGNERLGPARGWHPRHWRQLARDHLDHLLADSSLRPLWLALLVGDGAAMDDSGWERLRITGTVHLFVVSGLHIGMTGGLLLALASAWRRSPLGSDNQRTLWLAWLCAFAGALGYALVAGFGLPVQRALLMFAVAGVAFAGWRDRRPRDAWLLALLVVLGWDPLAVLQVGFWFSFLAVAALLTAVTGRYGPPLVGWRRLALRSGQVQWATFAISVPVLLTLGGAVPVVSLVANAVAIPLVSLLALPLALVAWLLDLSGADGNLCWRLADQVLALVWSLLGRLAVAGVPLQWQPAGWSILGWSCAGVAALLLLMPRPLPGRWLALWLMLPLLWPVTDPPAAGEARVTLFDVGQGLGVLVQTRHHAMLYDTGPVTGTGGSVAELTIVPALRRLGVRSLDLLVVSHGDSDHAGGWQAVRAALPVARTLVGESLAIPGESRCEAGHAWRWDGVAFSVLHPAWQSSNSNDNSCVIHVEAGGGLLLTGDIERGMEQHLRAIGALVPTTVVVAPHHGSRSSSSDALVIATQPSHVIFSTGYLNHFNHPDAGVAARWRAAGAELLNTAEHGMLRFLLGEGGVALEERYRSDRPHFWQQAAE